MSSYVHGDGLVLQAFREADIGLRPSHRAILDLIDVRDPAWPMTAAALREMADAGVKIDETAFAIAAKLGTHRLAKLDEHQVPSRRISYEQVPLAATGSIVYYIRRGDVIKIGTTVAPNQRFRDLMPDEILAYEPGTRREEKIRHRQFAHLRRRGEHFSPAPELTVHMERLRRLHGDPDPAWRTLATLKIPAPPRRRPPLPPPASEETVTVSEASVRLGGKLNRVRAWIRHGQLSPAGRNEYGHRSYYWEHVQILNERTETRARSRAS